jgi:hypothetical protein
LLVLECGEVLDKDRRRETEPVSPSSDGDRHGTYGGEELAEVVALGQLLERADRDVGLFADDDPCCRPLPDRFAVDRELLSLDALPVDVDPGWVALPVGMNVNSLTGNCSC